MENGKVSEKPTEKGLPLVDKKSPLSESQEVHLKKMEEREK